MHKSSSKLPVTIEKIYNLDTSTNQVTDSGSTTISASTLTDGGTTCSCENYLAAIYYTIQYSDTTTNSQSYLSMTSVSATVVVGSSVSGACATIESVPQTFSVEFE